MVEKNALIGSSGPRLRRRSNAPSAHPLTSSSPCLAVPDHRRQAIIHRLQSCAESVTGTELAEQFGVSRQVIVQDMAVLRAAGESLISTPRGYSLQQKGARRLPRAVVAVQHTPEQTDDELLALVAVGATVVDVAIDHPVYGEMRGTLMIRTADDVAAFLNRMRESGAGLLLNLTQGVHVHTLEAADAPTLDRAREALAKRGYLL